MRSIKDSISTLSCENLLECFYGINENDVQVYFSLVGKNMRIEEISEFLGKSENAIYKSLQKLLIAGLVVRDKKLIENGGYYYTYSSVPPSKVSDEMKKVLLDWCEKVKKTIEEFEKKYGGD